MDANQLTEKLMEFGLTRQEATVYLALVVSGTQTGYEVAKQTGISRSNAYNALAGLVDKGAAYPEEGAATRYTAVEVSEFCENKIRALTRVKEELTLYMPKEKAEAEGYLTVAGDDRTEMPEHARVYETQVKDYQVGVITDSTHVLTGEVGLGDGSSCLYTGQTNFVQIFKDSLKNEIKLIELGNCETSSQSRLKMR